MVNFRSLEPNTHGQLSELYKCGWASFHTRSDGYVATDGLPGYFEKASHSKDDDLAEAEVKLCVGKAFEILKV